MRSNRHSLGDYIRVTADFWTHPKVIRIAEIIGGQMTGQMLLPADNSRTNILRHVVCSAMLRLFVQLNRHVTPCEDGLDAVLPGTAADNYCDIVADLPGLQAALIEVEWLRVDPAGNRLIFPRYLAKNVPAKSEKRRGRPGDPASKEAVRKRQARGQNQPGQMPDNSDLSAHNAPGQIADKSELSADKSTQKENKNKNKKETTPVPVFSGGSNGACQPRLVTHSAMPAGEIARLQERVDALRPGSWGGLRHWNRDDEDELLSAAGAVASLDQLDAALRGHSLHDLLCWWFRWVERQQQRQHGDADSSRFVVTSKRSVFLRDIASYVGRAKSDWRREARPSLKPPEDKPPPAAKPLPAAEPPDTRTAQERAADLAAMLAAQGVVRTSPDAPAQ